MLLPLSLGLAAAIDALGLPAAMLIGAMVAGILAGTNGATVRMPSILFTAAQAMVGCLVAASFSPDVIPVFLEEWPLMAGAALSTLLASAFLGWSISKLKVLPGSTAVWGSAPGGATAMVIMAEAFGADARLVAFMQYLRVIVVSMTAAVLAGLWMDISVQPEPHPWFPPLDPFAFPAVFVVAFVGTLLGMLVRLPSPAFLGAVVVGGVAHLGYGMPLQLPPWLLAASYIVIGLTVGLNFTPQILRHAARALPQILVSILLLLAFCAGVAWLISRELGVDLLTAYLAMSPGGLDSVSIIAAASPQVDLSFVLTLQAARFFIVILFGGPLARLVARTLRD